MSIYELIDTSIFLEGKATRWKFSTGIHRRLNEVAHSYIKYDDGYLYEGDGWSVFLFFRADKEMDGV